MEDSYQVLRIFLSSPGDVAKERILAEEVVNSVSRVCRETLKLHLEIIKWENLLPIQRSEKTVQEKINDEVTRSHIFVLILKKRFGKPEPGFKKSNTQREIETALKMIKKDKKKKIFAYFREIPQNPDPGPQERMLDQLKTKLEKAGILYSSYKSPEHFKFDFAHHLFENVLRFRLSTFKHRSLSKFWRLGTPEKYASPILAVHYPSFDRPFISRPVQKGWWLNRLLPSIAFEDFKALQKIEKTLRLIGFRDFRFYASASPPTDVIYKNRAFICLPRNRIGLRYYERYKHRAKFKFYAPRPDSKARLFWRYSVDDDDYIEIRSPLAKYLKEQRKSVDIDGDWTREMGDIIAKDYAILARFRDKSNETVMREGYQNDYFFAGIRGLGTWGAAYFIDRKYTYFKDIPEDQDIQLLLEVIYYKDRIYNVIDVSKRTERYFKEQFNIKTIRQAIKDHKLGTIAPAGTSNIRKPSKRKGK